MLQKLSRSLRANRLLWASGIATAVCVILLLGRPDFTNASRPPGGLPSLLAIQFAAKAEEVELILSDAPSPDREVLRLKTYLDFALIAAYTTFFVALAQVRGNRWLAASALVLAALDAGENIATLRLIDMPIALTTQRVVDAVRWTAIAKWVTAGLTLALVLRRHRTALAIHRRAGAAT